MLRQARRDFRAQQNGPRDVWYTGDDPGSTVVVGFWAYVGRGYATLADAQLSQQLADEHAIAFVENRDQRAREKQLRAEVLEWIGCS